MLFSQTLLLLGRRKADCPCFHVELGYIFGEKSCKLHKYAQNSFFYVKIILWILTTNFTETALLNDKRILFRFFQTHLFKL